MDVSEAIKRTASEFGYPSVLAEQQEAIASFVGGKEVCVALPTGYGKSFCYCSLPCVFDYLHSKAPNCICDTCMYPGF